MAEILAHFQEHYLEYIIFGLCALPILYLTRKWSVPVIAYTLELAIYLGIMHVVVFLTVYLLRAFGESTSFRALDAEGRPVDAPMWTTPFYEFWDRSAYNPEWIFWMKIVFALAIIYLMWRYRPLRVQRKAKRKSAMERADAQKRGRIGGPASRYAERYDRKKGRPMR